MTLVPQETIRQHYVPHFYLSNFTDTSGFFQVFDKPSHSFFSPKSPKSVAYSKYFYAQETGKKDQLSQEIEGFLKGFDDYISKNIRSTIQNILSTEVIRDSDIYVISVLAANLYLRGVHVRNILRKLEGELAKEVMRIEANRPGFKNKAKEILLRESGEEISNEELDNLVNILKEKGYDLEVDNSLHLSLIQTEHKDYINMFSNKKLRIYVSTGSKKFITSDSPILETKCPDPKHPPYGLHFMQRLHTLPLTKDILVEFHDPMRLPGESVIRKSKGNDFVSTKNSQHYDIASGRCFAQSRDDLPATLS
jgi:hypothetical protein